MPKELDYVIFWPQEDIDKLQDPKLLRNIKKDRKDFDFEFKESVKIMEKYPHFFNEDCKKFENIKWIYTHLVTRYILN